MTQGKWSRLSPTQKTDIWNRWKAGQTLHEIGVSLASRIIPFAVCYCLAAISLRRRLSKAFGRPMRTTYVDFIREGECGKGAARWGNSHWRRSTEVRVGAKSVFHFDVPGSVAKSTHAGIPWLRFIRLRTGDRVHFWPHTRRRPLDVYLAREPAKGISVSAEVHSGSEHAALDSPFDISGCRALLRVRRGSTSQPRFFFRRAMAQRGPVSRGAHRIRHRRHRRARHFLCRPATRRNLENNQRRYDLVSDI